MALIKRKINNITINFVEGGLMSINAEAYVSASSIEQLPIQYWGGVAGSVRDYIKKNYTDHYFVLENEWKYNNEYIGVGTSRMVQINTDGFPYLFGDNFFIIHAGAPAGAPRTPLENWPGQFSRELKIDNNSDLNNIYNTLVNTYHSILIKIHRYNGWIGRHKLIRTVAIPPLGIGIYGIDPKISAKALYNAINIYTKKYNNELNIVIPIYKNIPGSNDYIYLHYLNDIIKD